VRGDVEVEDGLADHRHDATTAAPDPDVITVEGDVDRPDGGTGTRELVDQRAQPLRERNTACVQSDQRHRRGIGVVLDDLVRDARDGPAALVFVDQDPGTHRSRPALRCSRNPRRTIRRGRVVHSCRDSFPASRDRS